MKEKKVSGFDYLWCALYACAGFALELLLVQIEKGMGIGIDGYTTMQNIIHLLITIFAFFSAFLFGAAYVFVNKDYRKALPIIILLFML